MNPHKEHTVCQASSAALPVVSVARVTPSHYSTRKAICRYRHIQHFDAIESLAPLFQIRG
ncbi:MAG TPA: hypothetical protein VGC62_06120 [Pseudomonas sp.]|uniref:hypothetical protein n=1 Tax=Pseudomonas sp. TaxID=306 RepID=UPI002ED88661